MAISAKLKESLEKIQKRFGTDAIMVYGDAPKEDIEVISTGIPSLDKALGIGGLPVGRIVEVSGPEGSGKTSAALHIVAEAQKKGRVVAYLDFEHALDSSYAEVIGVDMNNLLFSQPLSGEEGLEIVLQLAESGEVSLIVIDSVAALVTKAELDGDLIDAQVAQVPRLLSKTLKKLIGAASNNKCTVVFINQLRAVIGGYGNGPTSKPSGGMALPYYASVRLDVRRIGAVKGSGEDIVGQKVKIKVTKNKLSAPHKEIETDLIFGEGFSKESDLLDLAIDQKIIEKKGGWFSYAGTNFAQGRDNARKALKDAKFYDEIKELVYAKA